MSFLTDWLSRDTRDLPQLDRAAFAFEFLRRHPQYVQEHAAARASGKVDLADLARRWGLSFPGRPAPPEP